MAAEVIAHPNAKYTPRLMAHELLEMADELEMVIAVLVKTDGTYALACSGEPMHSDLAFAGALIQKEALEGACYAREDFED